MMSAAVMAPSYERRRDKSIGFTKCVVENYVAFGHSSEVMNTRELLARLEAIGARNVDMARVLGLPDSRIAEIRKGRRTLKLDEAAKLVSHYNLENRPTSLVSTPVARLAVLHLADSLGVDIPDTQVDELAEDLRAFSAFLSDPLVRESAEAASSFFQGLQFGKQAQAKA